MGDIQHNLPNSPFKEDSLYEIYKKLGVSTGMKSNSALTKTPSQSVTCTEHSKSTHRTEASQTTSQSDLSGAHINFHRLPDLIRLRIYEYLEMGTTGLFSTTRSGLATRTQVIESLHDVFSHVPARVRNIASINGFLQRDLLLRYCQRFEWRALICLNANSKGDGPALMSPWLIQHSPLSEYSGCVRRVRLYVADCLWKDLKRSNRRRKRPVALTLKLIPREPYYYVWIPGDSPYCGPCGASSLARQRQRICKRLQDTAEVAVGWIVARNGDDPVRFRLQDWRDLVQTLWEELEMMRLEGDSW